jgi:predicted transcriptional regulator
MPDSGLPADVEQFISEYVRSVEHLEVLLAMAALPDAKWSVAELFGKVRSSESSVRERLEELNAQGLVDKHGELYQFSPKETRLREIIEQLAKAHKERSIRVIQTIYSERGRAVRELSAAFRFRKKPKDG